jgi:hypothetical protein
MSARAYLLAASQFSGLGEHDAVHPSPALLFQQVNWDNASFAPHRRRTHALDQP